MNTETPKTPETTKRQIDRLDYFMLKRVHGMKYRDVEFEEQCRLRSLLAYNIRSFVNEENILIVPDLDNLEPRPQKR